jgi:formate dehydrogenase alpha subunit
MLQPDRVVRSTCPFCGVGCQLELHVKDDAILRVEAPFEAAPNYGMLCVKGRFGTDYVSHPTRLSHPLIRTNTHQPRSAEPVWRQASWEEALDLVAERLAAIVGQSGGDAVASFACAKATNEDNYLLQKLTRAVLGSNNVDHCSRLCHAGSVAGLQLAIGSSAMSNSIAEMEHLDLFIVTGSNTTETHPVIANFLKRAVRRNQARLIVIDPRQIEMTDFATLWLRQRPGTDVAVWQAMAHVVVREKLFNPAFIQARTEGFAEYIESLESFSPEWAETVSGVPAEDIRAAARLYAGARSAAVYWGMGISQSTHGTDNTLAITNLALLCGQIGRPGTGLNPLRGQNNVQGCSDSGALPYVFTAYQRVDDPQVSALFAEEWRRPQLNPTPGLMITELMDAALSGAVRAFYVMGEDPLTSEPNLNHARHAMEQLDFIVCQDIFLTTTGKLADVILPSTSFAEKDGTFTNSDRRVQRVRAAVPAVGASRPDWQILCDLARRLEVALGQTPSAGWEYEHPSQIWDEMRRVTPDFAGITYDRLEAEGGVHWPCPALDHAGTPYLFAESFPPWPRPFLGAGIRDRERAAGCGVSIPAHHRPRALPLAWGDDEPALEAGRGLAGGHGRGASGGRRRAGCGDRRLAAGDLAPRVDRPAGDGHRALARGRGLHPVPLRRGRRQCADQRPPRPAGEDPGLQGVRRPPRADRAARRPRPGDRSAAHRPRRDQGSSRSGALAERNGGADWCPPCRMPLPVHWTGARVGAPPRAGICPAASSPDWATTWVAGAFLWCGDSRSGKTARPA